MGIDWSRKCLRPRSYKSKRARSSGMLRQGSVAVECRLENQTIAGGRKAVLLLALRRRLVFRRNWLAFRAVNADGAGWVGRTSMLLLSWLFVKCGISEHQIRGDPVAKVSPAFGDVYLITPVSGNFDEILPLLASPIGTRLRRGQIRGFFRGGFPALGRTQEFAAFRDRRSLRDKLCYLLNDQEVATAHVTVSSEIGATISKLLFMRSVETSRNG